MHEGTALLAGASTVPEGRRQGAQNALLDIRLRMAALNGCNLAMMVAVTRQRLAAQRRAAGIPDRLYTNQMATVIHALIVVFACLSPAAAQSTRVETIAEEQAEKAKALGAEGPSEAERIIRRVLLSPLLNGGEGVYPWFGSVYRGTGMAVGVGFLTALPERGVLQSPVRHLDQQLDAGARRRSRRRSCGAAGCSSRPAPSGSTRAACRSTASARILPATTANGSTTRPRTLAPAATIRPIRFVALTGGYTFMNFDTHRDAPRFSGVDAPGMDEELNYHVTRGTVAFDWRPSPVLQHARRLLPRHVRAQPGSQEPAVFLHRAGIRGRAAGAAGARAVRAGRARADDADHARSRPRGAGDAVAVSRQRLARCGASPTVASPIAIACC